MYWDDVKTGIKRAALTLFGVTKDLQDAKEYHDRRSGAAEADPDADKPSIRVPLLWGRF